MIEACLLASLAVVVMCLKLHMMMIFIAYVAVYLFFLFVDEQKSSSSSSASRNLWVSGLSASTRAADLKTLFSKHGKVMVLYCLFA